MSDFDRNIKLYHYDASPYGRKLVWYLTLRQIPYAEIKQPFVMPRPDVKAIGVAYRRIPLMAVGKDVYCDTRIMIPKLEEFFPEGKIGATNPEGKALQKLLDVWHNETGLFMRGAQLLPPAVFKSKAFVKDRKEMTGRAWDLESVQKARPDNLLYLRNAFSVLEDLLSDGRNWLLKTANPSQGDIEGIFAVDWLVNFKGALPEDLFSKSIFPRVYAWVDRFNQAIREAKATAPKVISLSGAEAAKQILSAGFAESDQPVNALYVPKSLQRGDQVEVFPTDSGSSHREEGVLLTLTESEIVIGLQNGLRLHTPRTGFRVRAVKSKI